MRALGAVEMLPVCEGDVDGTELDEAFDFWSSKVIEGLKGNLKGNGGFVGGVSGVDSEEETFDGSDDDDDEEEENGLDSGVVDLEDIAGKFASRKSGVETKSNGKLNGEKEMVTRVIRASLEKQVSSFKLTSLLFLLRLVYCRIGLLCGFAFQMILLPRLNGSLK